MLRAEELYLEISKVGPEGTEYIQSGTNIPDEEKTIEVKVISFDSSEETQKMTLERARYFHANDLRRCGSITHTTPLKPKPKQQNRQAGQKKVTFISESPIPPSTILTSKSEKKITEEKIFEAVNSSSNAAIEKLSAEDVAIRKATAVEGSEDSTKRKLESTGLLEYAAKGVLNKAIKAKNCSGSRDVNQDAWDRKGGSQKVWNNRCVRTYFQGVDLGGTYRTTFVNCTFDKDCTLPTEKSSIDQKYFSNCLFSKELMDNPKNKNLKEALVKAGIEIIENGLFYKVGNSTREKYGEKKGKEINPSTVFKPIESFKFVEGIEIWLKEIDR